MRRSAGGLIALALLAACSDRPDAAEESTPSESPSVSVVRTQAPPDLRSSVTVSAEQVPETTVRTEGGSGAATTVEVRVREILTELDATTTPEGTVVTLPEQVLFDFDQAVLRPEASATLDDLAEVIAFYADRPVSIRGHTDARGSDEYNQDLSQRRALAVRDDLVQRHGIDQARLEAVGFGETQPVAPNERPDGSDDPEGRQRNRRVEVVVAGATPP